MPLTSLTFLKQVKEKISSFSAKVPPPKGVSSKRRAGLSIGRFTLSAVEISQQGPKITLERFGKKDVIPNAPLSDQIKVFWKEFGFESNKVIISLKGRGIVIRFLKFPKMTSDEFSSSIQYEAEKYLPFSLSEIYLDHAILPEKDQTASQMSVILTAARKTEVMKLFDSVKDAGLKVQAIDVDTFASANAFERAVPEAKEAAVGLIDFGAVDTTISILDHGVLVFSRDIAFGGNDFLELLQRKLNIEKEKILMMRSEADFSAPEIQAAVQEILDRLTHEIKTSIQYYYQQKENTPPLDGLYIFGGFSKLAILTKLLQEKTQLSVKDWNPVQGFELGAGIDKVKLTDCLNYLPVSIGLALRPK